MEIFLTTFQNVSMLLTIGLLGFLLISRRVLPQSVLESLSRLSLEIALPCLVFHNIISNFAVNDIEYWWHWPLWFGGFTLAMGLLTLLFLPCSKPEHRRVFAASLFYQNAVFVPLVILAGRYGANSPRLVELFLFTLLFTPLYFGTAPVIFNRLRPTRLPWSRVFNPVVISSLLAIGICLGGGRSLVPGFLLSATDVVGGMTVPLLLIVLGGTIYLDLREPVRISWAAVSVFVAVKNLVFPALALSTMLWLQPNRHVAFLIVLQSAVPPITSLPIIAERYGGNRAAANRFLVASFIVSLVTIPLVVTLFEKLWPVAAGV